MIKILLVILSVLVLPACAWADITADIQTKYQTLNSFSAHFTQKLTHQESGSVDNRSGILSFAKPLLIRFETTSSPQELLIVNSKDVWDYLPEEKVAYQYAPEIVQDSRSILQIITGQSNLTKDYVVDISTEKIDTSVLLHLFPKEPTTQLVEAKLWVNPQSFLIYKVSIVDFYGNINELTFTSIEENPNLASRIFNFIPPAGVKVDNQQSSSTPERPLLQ